MKNISLIIYDFDGVMTDNRVLVFKDGGEAVFVSRGDGLAVKAIKNMGIAQLIVSTESNPVVKARAKKLGIPLMQSVEDKKSVIEQYLKKNKILKEKVIFVGNDINDKEAMEFIGWPVAPVDAHSEIKSIARIILSARGGYGVVRELLDFLKSIKKSKKG
ncbi:MAG: KdsC family phosphatase [Mobilitalea sp.]